MQKKYDTHTDGQTEWSSSGASKERRSEGQHTHREISAKKNLFGFRAVGPETTALEWPSGFYGHWGSWAIDIRAPRPMCTRSRAIYMAIYQLSAADRPAVVISGGSDQSLQGGPGLIWGAEIPNFQNSAHGSRGSMGNCHDVQRHQWRAATSENDAHARNR